MLILVQMPIVYRCRKKNTRKKKSAILESLSVSKQDIQRIAQETIGQSNSLRWHDERAKRITASTFGKICKQREATHCQNLIKQILYSSFLGNKSTTWGSTLVFLLMKNILF